MVGVMKIMVTSFKRSHACTPTLSSPATVHHQPPPPPGTPGHSWASLGQSLLGSLLLSPDPGVHKVLSVPSKSLFPQSCVSSGGVNGDLLQEGLCHTQVCCTQSLCPCSRPPLTCTSTGDAQTQFCLRAAQGDPTSRS